MARLSRMGVVKAETLVDPKTSLQSAVSWLWQHHRDEQYAQLRYAAVAIELELRLSPWTQTREFLLMMAGKQVMLLYTKGDVLERRGCLLCYERRRF